MAPGSRTCAGPGIAAPSGVKVRVISLKGLRASPFWPTAGWLAILLPLWTAPGFAADAAISRELTVHGQHLSDQLVDPLAEMKRELESQGCNQFAVAFWTVEGPTRLRVEVRCKGWGSELPVDARATGEARQPEVRSTSR